MSTVLLEHDLTVEHRLAPARLHAGGAHIAGLDGLRGIAILLVLLNHFVSLAPGAGSFVKKFTHVGWVGVDLFFVLSGFLITGILLDSRDKPRYFVNFYARRTLRIFPLYYGVLLVVFGGGVLAGLFDQPRYEAIWGGQGWFWSYLSNVKQAFHGVTFADTGLIRLSHFWSLAVEEQFYLVWPLVVFCTSRRGLLRLCVCVIVGACLLRCVLLLTGAPAPARYLLMPCRMDALAMGGLVALMVRTTTSDHDRILAIARATVVAAGLALMGIAVWRGGLHHLDPVVSTAGYSLVAMSAASLLVVSIRRGAQGPWNALIHSSFLRVFGKYSYGIYVFHLILWPLWRRVMPDQRLRGAIGNDLAAVAVTFFAMTAITFAVAVVSYHLYEEPFLRLKRFFSSGSPRANRSPEQSRVAALG